jgi:hypothetical protein
MTTNLNGVRRRAYCAVTLLTLIVALITISARMRADTGTCNGASFTLPFTDVPSSNIFFCAVASAWFSGLTNGTSAITYSPAANVPREQMAAFITRTLDQSLRRSNRRAVAQQWWRPMTPEALRPSGIGAAPGKIVWDGADLWAASKSSGSNARVHQIRARNGEVLTYYDCGDSAFGAYDVIVAAGYVFLTSLEGASAPGKVYRIRINVPDGINGEVTLLEDNTGPNPTGITFDGTHLWTANNAGGFNGGSITRISLSGAETTFTAGFTAPSDILWDGENLWVADFAADRVKRVDPGTGAVLQSILVGNAPHELLFDGANLWVSNGLSDSITVIRAAGSLRGTVLQTITGNGLDAPRGMAFDGEHVLVTNNITVGSVSLFKAADLTPAGNFSLGEGNPFPAFACSDGISFWIVVQVVGNVVRF